MLNNLESLVGGESLQLFESATGVYTFASFWWTWNKLRFAWHWRLGYLASPTDDLYCQVDGRFMCDTPPMMNSSGDIPSGATIIPFDADAPVVIV